MPFRKWLPWLALASVVLGAASTLLSLQSSPALLKQIARRRMDMAQLQELQRRQAGDRRALDAYEKLESRTAPALKFLAAKAGLQPAPQIRQRDDQPAAGGWTLRSVEMQFEPAKMAAVASFIQMAGEGRPPWRLVECSLTAAGPQPGMARINLAMETLEKKAP